MIRKEKTEKPLDPEKKVFLFDLDWTLVNEHFHNILRKEKIKNGEASQEKIHQLINTYGIKNQQDLAEVFAKIIRGGHAIGIISYTNYPEVIKPILEEILKPIDPPLTEKEYNTFFENLFIKTGLPPKELQVDGKNKYTMAAKEHFNCENYQIVFIDDDLNNLTVLNKDETLKGIETIWVPPGKNPSDKKYLTMLGDLIPSQRERLKLSS